MFIALAHLLLPAHAADTICAGGPLITKNDAVPGVATTSQAIVEFVTRVTSPGNDFVAPAELIATFDNDGTLWCEQPMYVQAFFAIDRVKALAAEHPEWNGTEPFA